jgi:hypothetical protein
MGGRTGWEVEARPEGSHFSVPAGFLVLFCPFSCFCLFVSIAFVQFLQPQSLPISHVGEGIELWLWLW